LCTLVKQYFSGAQEQSGLDALPGVTNVSCGCKWDSDPGWWVKVEHLNRQAMTAAAIRKEC